MWIWCGIWSSGLLTLTKHVVALNDDSSPGTRADSLHFGIAKERRRVIFLHLLFDSLCGNLLDSPLSHQQRDMWCKTWSGLIILGFTSLRSGGSTFSSSILLTTAFLSNVDYRVGETIKPKTSGKAFIERNECPPQRQSTKFTTRPFQRYAPEIRIVDWSGIYISHRDLWTDTADNWFCK